MSSQFRATSRDDAQAVSTFLCTVFGLPPDHPLVARRNMEWKYWIPHPDWEGSRGFVIERGADIVAHGSIVPLPCHWGDRTLKIVNLIDWAARPDSTGAGMSLLKRIAQMTDGVFVAGGSDMTQKILPALGFKDAAKAHQFAFPLRPFRRFAAEDTKSWRSVARLGRNLMWRARGSSALAKQWSSDRLQIGALGTAAIPFPHPGPESSAVYERSAASLSWFLQCPVAAPEFYTVHVDGKAAGYYVLTFTSGKARIADAWMESDRLEYWSALYNLAVQKSREHATVAEVTAVTTTPTATDAIRQVGFQERGRLSLRFLMRGEYPSDIRYQLMDGDGAFGHESFWT